MSLMHGVEDLHSQLKSLIAKNHDETLSGLLDDLLLRQKLFAGDLSFEDDSFGSISKNQSVAIKSVLVLSKMKIVRHDVVSTLRASQQ